MRLVALSCALLLPAAACAQGRDSARPADSAAASERATGGDSTRAGDDAKAGDRPRSPVPGDRARAESLSRRDSLLLIREMERIRSEPRRRPDARPPVPDAAAAGARPRAGGALPRATLGVALSSALVSDANGTTVRAGAAATVGGALLWPVASAARAGLALRASVAPLRVEDGAERWDAGRVWQVDAVALVERTVLDRLEGHLGAGATLLQGPDDVVPFRSGSVGPHWGAEVGVAVRLTRAVPLYASAVGYTHRLGGATVGDPVREPAWVRRAIVGVRYGD